MIQLMQCIDAACNLHQFWPFVCSILSLNLCAAYIWSLYIHVNVSDVQAIVIWQSCKRLFLCLLYCLYTLYVNHLHLVAVDMLKIKCRVIILISKCNVSALSMLCQYDVIVLLIPEQQLLFLNERQITTLFRMEIRHWHGLWIDRPTVDPHSVYGYTYTHEFVIFLFII